MNIQNKIRNLPQRFKNRMQRQKELKKLFAEFYALNFPYWNCQNKKKSQGNIFVFPGSDLIVPILWNMLLAKKVQEEEGGNIILGYYGGKKRGAKTVSKSFCISKIVKITNPNAYGLYKSLTYIPKLFTCKNGDDILKLRIDSNTVPVGENIYDWLIRMSKRLTISNLSATDKMKALRYIYLYFSFYRFVQREKITTFIYTDCDYERSAFTKVCQKLMLQILQVYDFGIIKHTETSDYKLLSCNQMSYSKVSKFISADDYKQIVEKKVNEHFTGSGIGYLDAGAFLNKRKYTKSELLKLYNLEDDRKCVLVASHAMSDAPHYAFDMIFKDYYDWFVNTIRILAETGKYHVFVKEHPSSKMYGEYGSIDTIMKQLNITNIYKIPEDLSTLCLFDFIDCFITCCGTIGIEAACFGIPVVTAAKGYYYGYGLDYNFSEYEGYKSCLENLEQLQKRSEIIDLAKIILSLFHYDNRTYVSKLIPDNTLFSGMDYLFDDYKLMKILNENLRRNSPKDDCYNSQLQAATVFNDDCYPFNLSNCFESIHFHKK